MTTNSTTPSVKARCLNMVIGNTNDSTGNPLTDAAKSLKAALKAVERQRTELMW
jgi:hypothetical protein